MQLLFARIRWRLVGWNLLILGLILVLLGTSVYAALNRSLLDEVDRELELAIAESAQIRATQDFREGLASFLEKRAPRWSGK